MATGDNVLTAISVARQCAILNQESEVWLADVVTDKRTGDEQIEWKSSLPNLQDPN
jgi:cation-transporting ATPase 13A2